MTQTSIDSGALKHRYYILLAALCLITFFVGRSALPTDIMEARNIVTAREIVADGNWLVPTMNGQLRLEKPPLPTWVAAAIEEVCPDDLAAQRTAAGVMGCVWTVYLFLLVRYVSKRDDLAAATVVVFLTCYDLVLMGRSATWDIYCHAFMMAAIYYLNRGLREDRRAMLWFPLAGLFMGLSFLSKGPVSFYALLLPYLLTLIALPCPSMKGKWGAFSLMIVIMLVVGGWWYAWLYLVHPAEVSAAVHGEAGAWSQHNVRPWYYYWRFFLEMGAWALLMLAALAVPYWKNHITLKREYLLSITWAICSLVLLSLMPEKKMRYLLPSLAPCSMAVACLIVHFKQGENLDRVSRWLYVVNGLIITVVVLAMPALIYRFGVKAGMISIHADIVLVGIMLVIAGWLVWSTLQYSPMKFISGIAALFVVAEMFLLSTIGHSFGNPDAHSISALRSDKRVEGVSFYHNDKEPVRIELVYELNRKILPLDLTDSDAVAKAMPCVIVSRKWLREEMPAKLLDRIDTVAIGTYDDNKHPKSDRHYTDDFINHATLLVKSEE